MSENNSLSTIYSEHHEQNRGKNFVLFEKERGSFISSFSQKKKRILDIGCRDGALTKYALQENASILGCDIDTKSLEIAKTLGIEVQYMDLNGNWDEVEKGVFELVMAFEIIEHLYHPGKVFQKINAALRSDGWLIGSVPNGFSLPNRVRLFLGHKKGTSLSDPTHINHFTYHELKAALQKDFVDVTLYPLVDKKWMWLARIIPSLFSYDFLFSARKK